MIAHHKYYFAVWHTQAKGGRGDSQQHLVLILVNGPEHRTRRSLRLHINATKSLEVAVGCKALGTQLQSWLTPGGAAKELEAPEEEAAALLELW